MEIHLRESSQIGFRRGGGVMPKREDNKKKQKRDVKKNKGKSMTEVDEETFRRRITRTRA